MFNNKIKKIIPMLLFLGLLLMPLTANAETNKASSIQNSLNKLNEKKPLKIVCYGDSITYGYNPYTAKQCDNPYPKLLQNELRNGFGYNDITVINKGHGGWKSEDGYLNLKENVLDEKPDLCILDFGTNDCIYNTYKIDKYNENIRNIIKTLQDNNIDVLLATPTPTWGEHKNELVLYSESIKDIAKTNNIELVDLQNDIKKIWEFHFAEYGVLIPDTVHLEPNAYKYIAFDMYYKIFDKSIANK